MKHISIWISLAALVVAMVSLYISVRKFARERKLESARKRTELMSRLYDAISSTKLSAELCKSSIERFSSKECRESWNKLIPQFKTSIDVLETQHAILKMNGGKIDSLLLENYTPDVVAQLKTSEHLQGLAKAAIEQCANCKKNVADTES
jgi:hypothetical protein